MKISSLARLILGLVTLLFLTSSCTTTRVATLVTSESDSLELFTTKIPERDYLEICYIQTDGAIFHTPQKLLDGLKQKGREIDADAIIHIKYDYQGWYPVVSGIAIRYRE